MLFVTAARASASTIVVPNANAATDGDTTTGIIFGVVPFTFQWVMASSQFTTVAPGSLLTAIGFRLPRGNAVAPFDLAYSSWDLQLSSSLHPAGSLDPTFANNIASNVVTVRSGVLNSVGSVFPLGGTDRTVRLHSVHDTIRLYGR
jgi:hypothetical protein